MVQSISRSLPIPAARPPPPHYQSILTPLLHRRFANACLTTLGFCYLEAILISDKSNFLWVLFPISTTGLKCLVLFFLSAMPILILRIAQLHVVKRAHPSPFHAFQRAIGSFATYSAIFTYVLSSVVFMALYLLSCSPEDQLGVVVEGRSYERPRLNERFLYLVFFSVFVGVLSGGAHVYYDRARLVLPEVPYASYQDAGLAQIPILASKLGSYVSFSSIFGPLVYAPFRYILWSHTLAFARHFYWLNRSAALPSFPVGPTLFVRSCFLAFMIVLSSEVVHAAFNAFFTEDPFQGGKTVTDKSSDPNGTLISGLRTSQAPLTQPMAFAELNYLAHNRPDRRRAIFADVDRKPSAWEQILNECLRAVNEVEIKLTELISPCTATAASAPPMPPSAPEHNSPPPIPVSQANILVKTGPRSPGRNLLDMVQAADGSASPSVALRKHLPIPDSFDASKATKSALDLVKEQMTPMLASSCGEPFRQTVQRVTIGAISNVRVPIDAVSALGKLVISSLDEDDYGVVQGHVGKILQSFCATLETLERYTANPPLHWTDTEAHMAAGKIKLEEPEALIAQLKSTIADIANAFAPFLDQMGLPNDVHNKLPLGKTMT